MSRSFAARLLGAGAALALSAGAANAAVTEFQNNLAGFNAAAGNPAVAIDFEAQAGQNLAAQTVHGVTFSSPDGNTLDVVKAADTFSPAGYGNASNVLPATSGQYVLSPGGTDLIQGPDIRQRDSLQLDFASAVNAFGADILFQSLDCCSFTSFAVYDAAHNLLFSDSVNLSGGTGAGGSWFVGVVSDSANISRIVFSEFDDNDQNPDSNIGYDTFRFSPAGGGVPEPGAWTLMIGGFGVAGAALRRRRLARA